jgi:hypothetical protein
MTIREDKEEEESLPVGFEQDPDSDDLGDGWFTYADGRRSYGSNADEAHRLGIAGLAKGGAWEKPEELPGKENAVAIHDSSNLDELDEEQIQPLASEAPEQPEQSPPPPAAPAAPPPKLLPLAGQTVGTSQQTQQGSTNQVQRTRSAMPEEVAMAGMQGTSDAYDKAITEAEDSRFAQAAATSARAAQVEQKGRELESAAAAGMAQQQARKAQTLQKITEVSARPTDNNKLWKDKGVLGTAFGLLGVILGGIKGGMLGTSNTAMESLQEQKRQNIQSQLADRDSELRGLERELGSIEAALPVFEARMNDALKQRAEALLLDEKSVGALQAGKQFVAQLELQKQDALKRGAEAYYGTIATNEATTAQTTQGTSMQEQRAVPKPTGGGMSDAEMVKRITAARDMGMLSRTGMTFDEAQKELVDYRQKAAAQNDFKGSIDELARTLGVTVTKNEDGSVTVSGDPNAGVRPLGLMSNEQARKVDRAYARLKKADVMKMLREPSASLQDEFGSISERPFYDDEIVTQIQEFYDLAGRVQNELDGGYNPAIPEIYHGRADTPEPPGAKRITGRVTR